MRLRLTNHIMIIIKEFRMISDKEMRKRIANMSPEELLKASETFEALFDLVHQQDNNSIANTNPDYYKGV